MAKSIMSRLSLLLCTLTMMNAQVCGQDQVNFTLLETVVPNGAVSISLIYY